MRTAKILFLVACMLRASLASAQVMQVGVTNMEAPVAGGPTAQFEVGTFTVSTSGATTTVSTGFQGKAAIFWTHGKTTTGESNGASFSLGFTDGTTYVSDSWAGDNAAATSNVGHDFWNATNALGILTNGAPSLATGGYITGVAFNSAPNMVVTFSATPATAYLVNYMLIGGSGITAYVGTSTMPTSIGVQHITAPGFQGNIVFLMARDGTTTGLAAGVGLGFGVGVSSTKRWTSDVQLADAQTGGSVAALSYLTASAVLNLHVGGSTVATADFTGWTTNGFDITYSTAPATADLFNYLVIKGGQWDCGRSDKPTTATTQSVTGLAFQPTVSGWFMDDGTTSASAGALAITTLGAATATAQAYAGAYHNDTTNTVAISSGSSAAVLHEMAATANASWTSFNSDGWTITWSATGTAYRVGWFSGAP